MPTSTRLKRKSRFRCESGGPIQWMEEAVEELDTLGEPFGYRVEPMLTSTIELLKLPSFHCAFIA